MGGPVGGGCTGAIVVGFDVGKVQISSDPVTVPGQEYGAAPSLFFCSDRRREIFFTSGLELKQNPSSTHHIQPSWDTQP